MIKEQLSETVDGIFKEFDNNVDIVSDFGIVIAEGGPEHPQDSSGLAVLFAVDGKDREETELSSIACCLAVCPFFLSDCDIVESDTCLVQAEADWISTSKGSKIFQLRLL